MIRRATMLEMTRQTVIFFVLIVIVCVSQSCRVVPSQTERRGGLYISLAAKFKIVEPDGSGVWILNNRSQRFVSAGEPLPALRLEISPTHANGREIFPGVNVSVCFDAVEANGRTRNIRESFGSIVNIETTGSQYPNVTARDSFLVELNRVGKTTYSYFHPFWWNLVRKQNSNCAQNLTLYGCVIVSVSSAPTDYITDGTVVESGSATVVK
jgi:hypothetical protein